MELKLDKTKKYAIALEGGGARGAYEIGVWQALDEAGIEFEAVAGTSVGALNGALFTMGDLEKAVSVWKGMELSKVIDVSENGGDLKKLVSGKFDLRDVKELAPEMLDIIRNKGLDVSPLRAWIREVVVPEKVRTSPVRLFATTADLTDMKALAVEINDLYDEEMWDMLLASAYHPTFRLEKLGGKLYADGGLVDSMPLAPLIDAGYRDIIAVHIPVLGYDRKDKIPDGVTVSHIKPDGDLGGLLNFDSEQSVKDMQLGYFDGMRFLYGLAGKKYYLDKTLSQRQALDILLDYYSSGEKAPERLREICEVKIPAAALSFGQLAGDYYDILLALAEAKAEKQDMERFRIYADREFFREVLELAPKI